MGCLTGKRTSRVEMLVIVVTILVGVSPLAGSVMEGWMGFE
jgi:hypothetical protein